MLKSISITGLLLASVPALAQTAPAPDAAANPPATAITVTATRAPTPIDQVSASVTVLDKAAIDRSQDITLADLLLRTPGVSLSRNGSYGTVTSLRIRGAEADQTVTVIDGVKINDPASTGGGYDFGNLLVGDAARIEVLRGPQSILWGSQAIGGVVNVVTPLPQTPFGATADVEAGSRGTLNARAGVGGKSGPVTWRLAGNAFTTNGISAISPDFGGRERDGYRNFGGAGRVEVVIMEGVSADLRGYYARGRVELDGFNADSSEYSTNRQFVGYAGLNIDLLDERLRSRIAYGYTDTNRDNYDPSQLTRPKTFEAVGRNERLEYQVSFAIAQGWNALFGVENERSRFYSLSSFSTAPSRGRAELTGIYGQLNAELLQGLTVSGGVRRDDHNRYGAKTLFSAGAVWALPTGTVLRANYGEGFKAPSLYQLYSEYGNQALNPERAKGWEAGVEQRLLDGRLTLGATYFERKTGDQIIFSSCSFGSTLPLCFLPGTRTFRFGYYQNLARAEAHGVEASGAVKLGEHLTIDGNYSWTVAEDRSPGLTLGKWLPRRPRHTANASATYIWEGGISTGVALRWAGKSYDDTANASRLDDYTLVDIRAEVPVTPQLRLFARVENLFDEEYQTVYRYGTLGRSVYAGVRARF